MKKSLALYLQKYCRAAQLSKALLKDMENADIVAQLRVLGLFGKILTGPWMNKFYENEDAKQHLEMIPYMHACLKSLEQFERDPSSLLGCMRTVFGDEIRADDVFASLRADPPSPSTDVIISTVSTAMLRCLRKQLSAYIDGALSNPTPSLMEKTENAPLNNIAAERVLGMFDSLSRKAPNASVGFIDCKVRASMNRTIEYLSSQTPTVQSQLIAFSIRQALVNMREKAETTCYNQEIGFKRMITSAQRKESTKRNKIEREMKGLLQVSDHAEIISRVPDDLKSLVSSLLKQECPTTTFQHVWDIEGRDVIYQLQFIRFKNTDVIVCRYDSVEVDLSLQAILADILNNDLYL